MCEEGCVCERERVGGGGDKWRNDRKGKVCHSPPEISGAQGIVVKSQPLTPRQYISPFFSP